MPARKLVIGLDGVGQYFDMTPEEEAEFAASQPGPFEPIPLSITRRQCARQLLNMGMVTGEEALAMTRTGEPPAMVAASFAQLSPEDAIIAEIDFAADTYMRDNPLLNNLMLATGANEEEINDFFRAAALL
jgi:hypothetical protein